MNVKKSFIFHFDFKDFLQLINSYKINLGAKFLRHSEKLERFP